MNKIKTYKDSKDFPFWNYKRVMQTGDFFYVIKGYESGDEVEVDISEMEILFNSIVEDYVMSTNSKNEEILLYGRYLSANNELNKLSVIYNIILLKQKCDVVGAEISMEDIKSVLETIKIQKSDDLEKQKEIISVKIGKYKNDIAKIKNQLEKDDPETKEEIDIDEQFINVCNGLEMQYDENKISLYQYGVMMKILIKKIESIKKSNNHGG
jgi:hypothetical protein